MKVLGKRSLSSLLKIPLDIGFFGSILVGGLVIVVLFVIGFSGSGSTSVQVPVNFDVDPSVYRFETADGSPVEAEIETARGNLNVTGSGSKLLFMPVLIVLPLYAVIIVVLHRLRRIFRRLKEGRPFLAENAKNLRFIGIAVIVGGLVWTAFVYWTTRIVVDQFTTSGVTLRADFAIRASVIFAGLILLIVAEVFREGAQMKSDMEAAREIQFSLVAETDYQTGEISIHSEMQPADSVGGDYYDVIDLGDGRIAFVLADVAGHGLPAALLMALLQGSLRSLISSGLRGAELVGKVNTYLVGNTPSNRMITFFYGELDPATGQLAYVNAGHNPPILHDDSGVTRLGTTAVVLGSFDGVPFGEESIDLEPGARLVLFTDGMTEAADPADEEYSEERLETLVKSRGDTAPADLIDTAFHEVKSFCGKAPQADDMTMMVVSRAAG